MEKGEPHGEVFSGDLPGGARDGGCRAGDFESRNLEECTMSVGARAGSIPAAAPPEESRYA